MRLPVLFSICLFALHASAEIVDFGAALVYGRHAVGFEERRDDGLTVSIWYPASSSSGVRLSVADYLGSAREQLGTFLSGAGLSSEAVQTYLNARMVAVRDAAAAKGRFPLVLVAQGNQHTAADQAVLCEYLASHGFVVATTPSPMLVQPMTDVEQLGEFAERQAAELWRAVDVVSTHHRVESNRIAAVGHSFGARAALLLAMSHGTVRAVVSLDGGIGSSLGVEQMRAAHSFRPGHTPPLLHLYETQDAFVQPDLTFLNSIGAESLHTEKIRALHHAHFSTLGFAAATIPELGTLTGANGETRESMAYVARRTLQFITQRLR